MEEQNPQLQEYMGKMNRPTPGQSLTEDPETPQPYVGKPEFSIVQEAIEYIFVTITAEEGPYEDIMSSLAGGVPIMEVTQVLLFEGFNSGKWNPDLMLLLIEPTAYVIMGLAEKAGIDYVVTSEDDEIDAEMFGAKIPAKTTQALQSKEIPEETLEQLESAPTTPSLMQRQ
jgi:hypothetical protein|tara:strand:- start:668 stop:1180 length:513 start_codon:yes stop_codon:yes gene_type:complete